MVLALCLEAITLCVPTPLHTLCVFREEFGPGQADRIAAEFDSWRLGRNVWDACVKPGCVLEEKEDVENTEGTPSAGGEGRETEETLFPMQDLQGTH